MHDRKLLSDSELDGVEISGDTLPAMQTTKRDTMRANFWAVIGFCVIGLAGAMFVPSSYLHLEQTSALLS